MGTKLILNEKGFPAKFTFVDMPVTSNETDPIAKEKELIRLVEKNVISKINEYNPKLHLDEIIYDDLSMYIGANYKSQYSGIIVDEVYINDELEDLYIANDYLILDNGYDKFARRVIQYVFITSGNIEARNSFVSQTIFPDIIEHMKEDIKSPSYTIAKHRFMFINLPYKEITANMLLRHLANLVLIDIDYVDIFESSTSQEEIPKDLKLYLKKFEPNFMSFYDPKTDTLKSGYFEIDFKNKKLAVSKQYIESSLVAKNGNTQFDFNGSSEKFYWIEMFPITIFAYNLGYEIDITQYEDFCNTYKNKFSPSSSKFVRCEVLLNYLKKYTMN